MGELAFIVTDQVHEFLATGSRQAPIHQEGSGSAKTLSPPVEGVIKVNTVRGGKREAGALLQGIQRGG